MFGYKLFKKVEIEKLKSNLLEVKGLVDKQEKGIIELFERLKEIEKTKYDLDDVKRIVDRHENRIVELDTQIKKTTSQALEQALENDVVNIPIEVKTVKYEEKPIKKVRRKNTKKTIKNED
jgi:hypothetical protein